MRHPFATLAMNVGIELADLQHLLGHENPATMHVSKRKPLKQLA